MTNEDLQAIVKDVAGNMLTEIKSSIKDVIIDSVIPGIDEAVESFTAAQTAEAEASSSVWVKIRNKLIINGTVKLAWSFIKNVVTKVLEEAEAAETAETTETNGGETA